MDFLNNCHISEQTRKLLKEYKVSFVFQPIFSKFDTIVAYEALMRPKESRFWSLLMK